MEGNHNEPESHDPGSREPDSQDAASPAVIADSPSLATDLDDSFTETRRLRHDGWNGPRMADFCRTLAESGVVTYACRACGMSAKAAYALRQRHPVFARAWEAAISMARERLADELLARSLKGSSEQIMRNGCIVGERHQFDNKLAFAILRRLDRRAELGATFRTPPAWAIPDAPAATSGDWQLLLDALSEDRIDDADVLLTPIAAARDESDKGEEGNDPPVEGGPPVTFANRRIWRKWGSGEWRTDFPPPSDFIGDEQGAWEDKDYHRALSNAEYAALAAAGHVEPKGADVTFDQDEAERDAFFAGLDAGAGGDPCPSPVGPPPRSD